MGATQQVLASYGGFVGPLDTLMAQGATLLYAGSVRRLLSSWTGDSMRLQGNGTGTPIAAIPFLANGDLDLTAAAAAASAGGGTAAAGETLYDQTGTLDAVQTDTTKQPPFDTTLQTKGGFGSPTAGGVRYFLRSFGTLNFPVFFCFVVNFKSTGTSLQIISGQIATRYCGIVLSGPNMVMSQNWGSLAAGSANVTNGKHILGYLANGASSAFYLDGSAAGTGDANTTQTDMTAARIGNPTIGTVGFFRDAENIISEVVVFSGDPTGLAGWSTFVANQKSYFGVA